MQVLPWYERDAFWTAFRRILFPPARFAAAPEEAQAFAALTGIAPGARVLDLGCGPGRHSLALARLGHQVTGLDRTRAYLDELQAAARSEGLDVRTLQADMREIPGTYDAILSAFTTFGYFGDPADDRRMLQAAHDALAPGGALLLDVLGKEVVARGFQDRYWTWLEPDLLLLEARQVEGAFEYMVNQWTLIQGVERRSYEMRHRLYGATELRGLLADAGFVDIRLFGSWTAAPYDARSDRLLALARRGRQDLS